MCERNFSLRGTKKQCQSACSIRARLPVPRLKLELQRENVNVISHCVARRCTKLRLRQRCWHTHVWQQQEATFLCNLAGCVWPLVKMVSSPCLRAGNCIRPSFVSIRHLNPVYTRTSFSVHQSALKPQRRSSNCVPICVWQLCVWRWWLDLLRQEVT